MLPTSIDSRDTVAVEFLSPNIDVVRKLDPRGSCFVTTPPGSSDNICILWFAHAIGTLNFLQL